MLIADKFYTWIYFKLWTLSLLILTLCEQSDVKLAVYCVLVFTQGI